MTTRALILDNLSERHPGVTKTIADTYYEAACVCLDRHHTSPVIFDIDRVKTSCKGATAWVATDERTKGAWGNDTDTTETGAYGVALAAVEVLDGMVAVARAEKLTGADYYVGSADAAFEDLETTHRLEVSGVDRGGMQALKARLAQKVRQATKGNSDLPAIAAVVGFAATTVLIVDVEVE